jgi:hypothetical protein
MAASVIEFGEWLPDQPSLGSTGLTEAHNVLPASGYYQPYQPLVEITGASALAGTARGLFTASSSTAAVTTYAATGTMLYSGGIANPTTAKLAAPVSASALWDWQFAQYENYVFACNGDNSLYHTLDAAGNFAASGAPDAFFIGVVGQFVVVGNINDGTAKPYSIRWCDIDSPLSWSTPGSAAAIAAQAGEQTMPAKFGQVVGIVGGDQHALVLQEYGVTRMTYVGGNAVFQFDEIETTRGAFFAQSIVRAGAQTFFIANDGFCVCNGVSVTPIGEGKVNKTLFATLSPNCLIRGSYNHQEQCVFWSHGVGVETTPTTLICYHIPSGRFSRAAQALECVDTGLYGSVQGPYAFSTNHKVASWESTTAAKAFIGTATIATADAEFNPGGRTYVGGVKPHVESTGSAPTVTMRLGTRNALSSSVTYTAATSLTSRTGFADFRSDAKYHRAELSIVGAFTKANGLEFRATPSGDV